MYYTNELIEIISVEGTYRHEHIKLAVTTKTGIKKNYKIYFIHTIVT